MKIEAVWYKAIALIFIFIVSLSACSGSTESDTNVASQAAGTVVSVEAPEAGTATEEVSPQATATQAATEEATQAATEASTEVATAEASSTAQATDSVTPEPQPITPNNGSYSISVSYTLDGSTMNAPSEDQTGLEDLVVVSSLENQTSGTVAISAEDIVLVDADANRFEPEAPNSATQPPLIGAELAPNESILGLVSFHLPSGTVPAYLEWCIEGDCEQAVQAPIP